MSTEKVFLPKGIRDIRHQLGALDSSDQAKYLSDVINAVGEVAGKIPTEKNETDLLGELAEEMNDVITLKLKQEVLELLAKDRKERILKNGRVIFKRSEARRELFLNQRSIDRSS